MNWTSAERIYVLIFAAVLLYVVWLIGYGIYYRLKYGKPQKPNYPLMIIVGIVLVVLLILYKINFKPEY